ncbi:2Fe-2S iron-sulfur cluster-binding protein [Poseidonibacter sp.]|uniref:2Fe-2S iron-sulfur cluster-binding protein n=1 Tax=Poseidonibacter sp. TaxID=2321188 RepID=UPI00359E8111
MNSSKYQLKMVGLNKVITVCDDSHLLDSMSKGGIEIAPNGCHGGGCGVCKIKILKGEVKTLCMSKKYITEDEKNDGYSLACRAFPLTDIEFEFIGKPICKVNKKKKYGFV